MSADEARDEAFRAQGASAFVLGATGEVGKELVKQLLARNLFSRLVLIGRRAVEGLEEGAAEQVIVDFEQIDAHGEAFAGLQHGFCCLGTTRGKAGAEGFFKVDHDYVLGAAKLAQAAGCAHFHLVSSSGASQNSRLLYPQTKGKVEEAVKALEFPRLSIYRPGLLQCSRAESRPGEAFFRALMKPLSKVSTWGQIHTSKVAAAMINVTLTEREEAVQTYENKELHRQAAPAKPPAPAAEEPAAAAEETKPEEPATNGEVVAEKLEDAAPAAAEEAPAVPAADEPESKTAEAVPAPVANDEAA